MQVMTFTRRIKTEYYIIISIVDNSIRHFIFHHVKIDVMDSTHRIYSMPFANVYPLYIAKAERKGRTRAEVDEIISWLTGYSKRELEIILDNEVDFETFFTNATNLNPLRSLIKGVVCGVRVEDIQESTMREIRYLDKLIDELAKGKSMEKILRK